MIHESSKLLAKLILYFVAESCDASKSLLAFWVSGFLECRASFSDDFGRLCFASYFSVTTKYSSTSSMKITRNDFVIPELSIINLVFTH